MMNRRLEREIPDRWKWSPRQRRRYQEKQLRAVLSYAMKNVPFYQKRFRQHGLSERDLRHLQDPTLLPCTSATDLESNGDSFLAKGVEQGNCVYRSRPTARQGPVRIYLSNEESELIRAVQRRIEATCGLGARSSRLAIVQPDEIPPPAGWRERWRRGRHSYLSVFETVPEQLRVLKQEKPERVLGPLWTLNRLARAILDGSKLGFSPKVVLSWGEPLRSSDRERLEEAFGVEPTDLYQAWEFGPIAAEGPEHEGLVINFDLCYVEVLHGDHQAGPGEVGEVVITSLGNSTMPLIRYRIGDLASWKRCPGDGGGEGLVLEAIHGRTSEAVRLPSGAYVSSRQLEECLDQFTNVRAYRAYQVEPRKVEVHVVPDTLFQERTQQLLRKKCIELFSNQMGVELRVVRELPILETPRRCAIVQKLPPR